MTTAIDTPPAPEVCPPRAKCRHCRARVVTRPRGLCWPCYYTPDVLALYPPGSANPDTEKYARRGFPTTARGEVPTAAHGPDVAPDPDVLPGSDEKLALMFARAARGLSLFAPGEIRDEPKRTRAAGIYTGCHYRGPVPSSIARNHRDEIRSLRNSG